MQNPKGVRVLAMRPSNIGHASLEQLDAALELPMLGDADESLRAQIRFGFGWVSVCHRHFLSGMAGRRVPLVGGGLVCPMDRPSTLDHVPRRSCDSCGLVWFVHPFGHALGEHGERPFPAIGGSP